MRATVHTTTQYTLVQLVFGRDSILNTHCKANHQLIKSKKIAIVKNTHTTKGTESYLKMHGKLNLTKMHNWDPTQSQLPEMMALLGPVKVKSQTPSAFVTLYCTRNKCSSIMGKYDIH